MTERTLSAAAEQALLDGLRKRDAEAFASMVRRFSGLVMHKVRFMIGDAAGSGVEDVAQEIFVKAFRDMHQVRGPRVAPWLMAITHNHCLDVVRQRQRQPTTQAFEERHAPAVAPAEPDPIPDLLRSLTPTERLVVMLRAIDHLDYAEISRITGLAVGTARNTFCHCMKRLREERAEKGTDGL